MPFPRLTPKKPLIAMLPPKTKRDGPSKPTKEQIREPEIFIQEEKEYLKELIKQMKQLLPYKIRKGERQRLKAEQREIYDMQTLLLEATLNRKIGELKEFEKYLKNFLIENLGMAEEQAANEARKAYLKFMLKIGPKRKILNELIIRSRIGWN